MDVPPATTEPRGLSPRAGAAIGLVILALLCAVALGLTFRSGAYSLADWLPFTIGVAALAVMVSLSGPRPAAGRMQLALLGLFALLALWTTASLLWATSLGNAWEEADRTLFYAVALALTFAAVRWAGPAGLRALAALLTAAVGIVALVIAVRLAASDDPLGFFVTGRLYYPVSYYNALAALIMTGFWLALGLANGIGLPRTARSAAAPRGGAAPGDGTAGRDATATQNTEAPAAATPAPAASRRLSFPRWTQPVLLALAVFLVELALLPQSRGALWTFFLVVPFFVILSPHRFRALVDLGIVVLPVVLFWGRLNDVYAVALEKAPLAGTVGGALQAVGYSVLIVVGAWTVTWVVERMVGPLSRRLRLWIGIVLIVLAVAGAVGGLVYADQRTGGLGGYLGDRWAELTGDQAPDPALTSRFIALGLSGRIEQWKVAGQAFDEHTLLGIGAQNFELYHYQHRTSALDVKNPHSQPLQVLAELGLPGIVLYVAFIVGTLLWALVQRFREKQRVNQAVLAAMMTAVIAWTIHSSADWMWQVTALTLPVMMLFGGLIAAGGPERRAAGAVDAAGAGAGPAEAATQAAGAAGAAARRFRLTRPVLALLALAVLVSAALPYLCLRYCSYAAGSANPAVMAARTQTAAKLDPTSVAPFATRAAAYGAAAARAPEDSFERLAQLQQVVAAWEAATELEPGYWLYFYQAAASCLAARDTALAIGRDTAAGELAASARAHLDEAKRLNPLSERVKALEARLQ